MAEDEHPYRAQAIARREAARFGAAPRRVRNSQRLHLLGATAVAGAAAGYATLAEALGWFSASAGGVFVVAWLGSLVLLSVTRRRRALRALEAQPFPVRHAGAPAKEQVGIEHATIELSHALDAPEATRAARGAQTAVPALTVTIDDRTITLADWPKKPTDIVLLVALLATWGRDLHGEHPIAAVEVTWRPGPTRYSV